MTQFRHRTQHYDQWKSFFSTPALVIYNTEGVTPALPVTACWSSGMILVSGARGPGFDSRTGPYIPNNVHRSTTCGTTLLSPSDINVSNLFINFKAWPIDPYHSMSKQKILPVEPLIQCEAGRAKTMQRQSLYSPRTPKWPPRDKGE